MGNVVHVIDAADNRLAHTIKVDGQPYQVAFTQAFAYVRQLPYLFEQPTRTLSPHRQLP